MNSPLSGRKLVLVACIDCDATGQIDGQFCNFCQSYGEIWVPEDEASADRVRDHAD